MEAAALCDAGMVDDRDCPFLDGLGRQELLARAQIADAQIREATNVLLACMKRLR